MNSVEELLVYLVTAIIRYHDSQNINVLINETNPYRLKELSRNLAEQMLTRDNLPEALQSLNEECTQTYKQRQTFLTFLVNRSMYLRKELYREQSFTDKEFEQFKTQVKQMFDDFIGLLKTCKAQTCSVHFIDPKNENTSIDLSGLLDDSYWKRGKYCNAGVILMEQVLTPCDISTQSTSEFITKKVHTLCDSLQIILKFREAQEKINQLESKFIIQEEKQPKNEQSPQEKMEQLIADKTTMNRQIAELRDDNSRLQKEIDKLQHTNIKPQGLYFAPLFNFHKKNTKPRSIPPSTHPLLGEELPYNPRTVRSLSDSCESAD